MVKMQDIRHISRAIGRRFEPQRGVLFGSHASGKPTPDSDVDLLVVMRHNERKSFRMATRIRRHIRPPFPMDLLVRTPEGMAERLALGDSFFKEVKEQGIVLYESPD
ncbi:MAG: nucleotidyltransferase domain-containing protein [Candidatus Hydrogenedentota bacterium]